jgi:hypothetical protein
LVLGVSAVAGFAFLLASFASAFLPSGVGDALTGEAVGEALGDVTGLDVAVGAGVDAGGLGGSVFGSQAPRTAIPAVRTVDRIIDLLMIFSSY